MHRFRDKVTDDKYEVSTNGKGYLYFNGYKILTLGDVETNNTWYAVDKNGDKTEYQDIDTTYENKIKHPKTYLSIIKDLLNNSKETVLTDNARILVNIVSRFKPSDYRKDGGMVSYLRTNKNTFKLTISSLTLSLGIETDKDNFWKMNTERLTHVCKVVDNLTFGILETKVRMSILQSKGIPYIIKFTVLSPNTRENECPKAFLTCVL